MSELSDLQEGMAKALRSRGALTKSAEWTRFADEHIAVGSRLSPVEQLEIYREQFWLRHTSSLVEDFPGLGGILGQADWERLTEAYLEEHTPESYTLRDLGLQLPSLIERASWLPHQALCLDMARLEVAYVEVFDAPDTAPLSPDRLATIPEESFAEARLVVAPCVRLLTLRYAVADLRRRLRLEGDEPVAIPAPAEGNQPLHVVVYRRDRGLWDMKVSSVAHSLLAGLVAGRTLGAAAELAISSGGGLDDATSREAELTQCIGAWLEEWTAKGLLSDVVI
jgi:Putative DNA-binding domain